MRDFFLFPPGGNRNWNFFAAFPFPFFFLNALPCFSQAERLVSAHGGDSATAGRHFFPTCFSKSSRTDSRCSLVRSFPFSRQLFQNAGSRAAEEALPAAHRITQHNRIFLCGCIPLHPADPSAAPDIPPFPAGSSDVCAICAAARGLTSSVRYGSTWWRIPFLV